MDQLGPVGTAMMERLGIAGDLQHLDIATGTDEPGLSVAALAPGGHVVLTDLSAEMLGVAARRANAQGITNCETRVCSADDLPFGDAAFDSVSVRFGYMFFPDAARATAEFVRVLKPGGRLCSSVWVKPGENPWTAIVMQAIAAEAVLAPPDPDSPTMFRCAAPGYVSACTGRGAAGRGRVGRRRRTRDAIARGVLGDDERARLTRSRGASASRRTGAGADRASRHRQGQHLRGWRWQGQGSRRGPLHRRHEVGPPPYQSMWTSSPARTRPGRVTLA
jgi:SAM-dependent methyltransferase